MRILQTEYEKKEEIEMNFTASMNLASQLEEISKKMKSMIEEEIKESFEGINKSWESENAALFLKRCNSSAEYLQELYLTLQDRSEEIREYARKMYEAEQISLLYAQARKYR